MAEKRMVAFDLECVELPDSKMPAYDLLRLGLQEKKDVKQDVACSVRQARFMFTLDVMLEANSKVFYGPYVQGKPGDQFVYLVWGKRDGEQWETIRRLKVPLTDIGVDRIQSAIDQNMSLAMRIIMTNSKGEPITTSLRIEQIEWL